jgi:hypothetical protein
VKIGQWLVLIGFEPVSIGFLFVYVFIKFYKKPAKIGKNWSFGLTATSSIFSFASVIAAPAPDLAQMGSSFVGW